MHQTHQRTWSIILFALLALCSSLKNAHADNLAFLKNSEERTFIGTNIYLTPHTDEKLDAATIAVRHKSNLRGTRNNTDLVNLSEYSTPVWLAFNLKNNSSTKKWILHLGDVTNGRQSLIQSISVFEHQSGTLYLNTEKSEKAAQVSKLRKNALLLEVEKNQDLLFIVKIATNGPFPHTLAPSVMTHEHYMTKLNSLSSTSNLFKVIILLILGAIIALSVTHKAYAHLIFGGYLLLQTTIYVIIEHSVLDPQGITSDILFLILIAAIFTKWLASQVFFLRTSLDDMAMLTLIVNGAALMICFMISIFIGQDSGSLSYTLTLIPLLLSALTGTCLAGILTITSKRLDTFYLTASWGALLIGFCISTSLSFGLITPTVFFANMFWLCILGQSLLCTTAIFHKIHIDKKEEDTQKAREKRAEASMARLQQAKETSDQARLLRVIERERELMAELREREILRTEEMRKAKNMADEANRAKSGFLAVVSHEVRTPMNGIMGMIRLLKNTKMTKPQTEYLQSMETSGDTMLALLNDILDFEKIESGNMELENIEFNMPKLVQDVITLMTGHANEKETQLTSHIAPNFPPTLIGDPTRLRQVILNLVSNAIKFTENGTVTIELTAITTEELNKDNNNQYKIYEITCAIKDTGIGISKEAQETLFAPFTQADKSTARKYGGTGLGLTICRRLVEAMRGKITLESEESVGSTFAFTLKTKGYEQAVNEEQSKKTESSQTDIAPMTILVIEDNEINRKVLKGFLEKDGHKAILRESGESALRECQTKKFDAIITDINLDGMSGLEFTKNLRLFPDKKIASTPVIALSGNVDKEDIRACYQANMNGFLAKPIDPDTLSEMLFKIKNQDFEQKVILPNQSESIPTEAEHSSPETQEPTPEDPEAGDDVILMPPPSSETEDTSIASQVIEELDDDFDSFADLGAVENPYKPQKPKEEVVPIMDSLQHETNEEAEAALQEQDITPFTPAAPPTFETIDPDFLEMVAGSLPTDQVTELLKSFTDKADEIVNDLENMIENPQSKELYGKTHELKGMAANFGMTLLAEISGTAEKAAKNEDVDTAIAEIKKLPDANRRAQEELKAWLETF